MKSESVLVVDDEAAIRSVLSEALGSFGYGCMTAADGYEALRILKREDFEIVLSDICMPGMTGFDLIRKTREIKPEVSFILITGRVNEYSLDAVVDAGASELIFKPFKSIEVKHKLSRIFNERRLFRENKRLLLEQQKLNDKFTAILKMSRNLTANLSYDQLLELIIDKTSQIMEAERASLYLINWEKKELWTKVAQKIDEIHIPIGKGLSGRVALTGKKINVKDAWKNPFFNRKFDKINNFRTQAVLCMPVYNNRREMVAVLQVLNRSGNSIFDKNDEITLEAIASQVAITLENHSLMNEIQVSFESSIRTLTATVDARHPLTAGHSQRVTEYSMMIARRMGLDENELEVIKYAALLHDIGKIGIRDDVLLKRGTFTQGERKEMDMHPLSTLNILENFHFPSALKSVPIIASQHHEKVNGTGYPSGIKGEHLPLGSKILAVADVFDALTSKRDYPKYKGGELMGSGPMHLTKVIEILKEGAGEHFDPGVVNCFLECLDELIKQDKCTYFTRASHKKGISACFSFQEPVN